MSAGVQDAIARKKLRVDWHAPDGEGAPAREAMLEGLWAALRQRHAAPATSQDEAVEVRAVTPGDGAGIVRVVFRYVFDRDFASQYDQREAFDAEIVLDRAGALVGVARWDAGEP